ncbi:hypothetical protein LO763_21840 [Glycomyces sp. A-F 0318]|uniref:hypothetical protein n=1 Tax=Glycomyces amatae TaxID=2881355 RepID=UPI001E591D19|nr:hypothetical protein [Glycomyces amatae]MCD0446258.1 hypothetical protein [Glycomyces amatae]
MTLEEIAEADRIREAAQSRVVQKEEDRYTLEERDFLKQFGYASRPTVWGTDPDASPMALIPVAQLFARDVPELPFGEDADLLQVLWCPFDHPQIHRYRPTVELRWRRFNSSNLQPRVPPEGAVAGAEHYVPKPCMVDPEPVTEYPDYDVLPPELLEAIEEWEGDEDSCEYRCSAIAPGWKTGGYGAAWAVADAMVLTCDCGAEAVPLLTIADSEWDSSTSHWMPVEDREHDDAERRSRTFDPVGVRIGRSYDLQVFHCGRDPRHQPVAVMT